MNYAVLYKPDVLHQIDRMWNGADDKELIAQEIEDLNRMLAHDPVKLGESRSKGRRITFTQQLGVIFRVIELELTVIVVSVWRIR